MKNREVKKMLMRKAKKTTVAMLIAANMMSMAVPAFAADNDVVVEQEAAPTQENIQESVQEEAPAVVTPEAPVQEEAPAVVTPEAPVQEEAQDVPVVVEYDDHVEQNVIDAVDGEEYHVEFRTPEAPVQDNVPDEAEVYEQGNNVKENVQDEFDDNECHVIFVTPEAPKEYNNQNLDVMNEEPEVNYNTNNVSETPDISVVDKSDRDVADDDFTLFHDNDKDDDNSNLLDDESDRNVADDDFTLFHDNDKDDDNFRLLDDEPEVKVEEPDEKYYTNDGAEVPVVNDSDNDVADDDFTLFHDNDKDDDNFRLLDDEPEVEEDLSKQYETFSKEEQEKAAILAEKEAAIIKAFNKKLGQDMSDASTPLYYNVKRIINTDYDRTEDMVADILKVSMAFAGDAFIKNIPGVGGFLQAYTHEVAGMDSATAKLLTQMQAMEQSIKDVTTAVNSNGQAIINALQSNSEKELMQSFDQSANKLIRDLESWDTYCIGTLDEIDRTKDPDELDCTALAQEFANVYTTDLCGVGKRSGSDCYADYMAFLTNLMQTGFTKSTEDIFVLTDRYYLGNGVDIAKEAEKRTNFANEVSGLAEYGNLILTSCMDVEMQNLQCICDIYTANIKELQAKKKYATEEECAEINKQISELKAKRVNCNNRLAIIEKERKAKDELLTNVRDRIEKQMNLITLAEEVFQNSLSEKGNPALSVQVGNTTFGVVTNNGETLYPSISSKGDMIEYRDIYGNLYGARNLTSSTKSMVDKYDVKAGSIYYVTGIVDKFVDAVKFDSVGYRCKVIKVWEKENLFFGTTRTGVFEYVEGPRKGEQFEYPIGSGVTLYEVTVGNYTKQENPVKKIS